MNLSFDSAASFELSLNAINAPATAASADINKKIGFALITALSAFMARVPRFVAIVAAF